MKILVVGGAGYVGSHVLRAVLNAGHDAWAFDNLSLGHAASVPLGRLIVGDLNDRSALARIMSERGIEAVLHLAARTLVGESVQDPAKYYQNNVTATLSLFDAMRDAGVSRIVFSSTTAVYGEPAVVPIDETQPLAPINPYGFTKRVVEQVLADYAKAYGWSYAALRYFNAAGASPEGDIGEDHRPESHLIPLVLQVALGQRKELTIFGRDYPTPDGTCIRDYVHVDDLAAAHLAALDRLAPGVTLQLNLGTGRGYSVQEVVDACRRITGEAIPTVDAPRRPGDAPRLVADASRARQVLGWVPRYTDLNEIVATAWAWHSRHPQGFQAAPKVLPVAPAPASDGIFVTGP